MILFKVFKHKKQERKKETKIMEISLMKERLLSLNF